jgi:integrase
MRRGEVCGLRWADVDLERGRVHVRQQLTTLNGKLIFSARTKTDRGRRTIDLDPATAAVVRAQRARQAEHRLILGGTYEDHDLVFAHVDGTPLDPESVAKVFDRRVARSGLPRIRFHDLRHSHVAHLIAAGSSRFSSLVVLGTRPRRSRWTATATCSRTPAQRRQQPSRRWWMALSQQQ